MLIRFGTQILWTYAMATIYLSMYEYENKSLLVLIQYKDSILHFLYISIYEYDSAIEQCLSRQSRHLVLIHSLKCCCSSVGLKVGL